MQMFKMILVAAAVGFTTISQAQQKAVPDTLNVKDFGAVGNNQTDDGPALQQALNKAAERQGNVVVFIPNGIYRVLNPGNGDSGKGKYGLRIGSNITLVLAENAVLRKKGNEELIGNADPVNGNENILITGGIFETDSGTDQKWAPTRTGILFINVNNSKIYGSLFRHIGNSGIILKGKSANNEVFNCRFTDIFNCGIELLGERNTARDNYLYDMGSDGILVKGNDCVVNNNKLVNIGQYSAPSLGSAISLGPDNQACRNNKVTNNIIIGSAAHGIINDRSSNTIITGNTIRRTGSSAIKLGGDAFGSTVSNNIIDSSGLSTDLKGVYVHSGIIIDGARVSVTDNKLTNVVGNGIYVNSSAANVIVKGTRMGKLKKAPESEAESKAIEVKAADATVEEAIADQPEKPVKKKKRKKRRS